MDIGYVGAFLGGLLALLSPCSVMLLPAFFAYAFRSPQRLLSRTGVFLLGLLVTLIPLGVFSGTFGALLGPNRRLLIAVVAGAVILLGLLQLLAVPIPGLARPEDPDADRTSALSTFLLGAVYAVAGACTGPILGSVLMIASLGGSPAYGAVLLALYALGMWIPLLVLALIWRAVGARAMRWMRPRMLRIGRWSNSWTAIITGVLSIALGVLLLTSDGTAALNGVLGVDDQFALESEVGAFSRRVPDLWLAIAVVVVAGALLLGAVLLRRRRSAEDEKTRLSR